MSKKMRSGIVIFSMFLVLGIVVYLNAAPQYCDDYFQDECEIYYKGDFLVYFEFWAWMYGDWVDVYRMYCIYEDPWGAPEWHDWGLCYDIDDYYPRTPPDK